MSDDKMRTRAAAGDTTAGGSDHATTEPGTENTTGEATIVPTWGVSSIVGLPDPGYQLGEQIGHGGMGEIVAAQDLRVGREVAVKRIRSKALTHDAVQRFLREARIQARLDHPAIVPVYELGTDADGRPYFTMKRLTGVTLAKRLVVHGPVQPLLRAFVDVCRAIQLAHSRGVIHRDLKPSNIMLGDYGEVYVIDWGVARVLGDRTRTTHPMRVVDDVTEDEQTTAGAILGTPGYMPPEQIRGSEVGTPADVYSLGAILFEILAGESLHPRGEAALATTLTAPQVAPATRALERTIAPELDGVCFDALAEDPKARPTARQLADRIQAYLDGDRDLERRRTLAIQQLAAAQTALDSDAPDARATAMRRAGRALALDPDSQDAAALVTQLIVEPPAKLPADLVASLEVADRAVNADRAKKAMWAYASLVSFVPLVPFLDIKSWMLQFTFWSLIALLMILAYGARKGRVRLVPVLVTNLAFVVVFSRLAGPFILTPIITAGVLLSFSSNPYLVARRWILIGWALAAVALPIGLELVGVLPRTFEVVDGSIHTTSEFFTLHGGIDEVALIAANCGLILIAAWFGAGISRHREQTRRTNHIQTWHLRQLLPNQQPRSTRQ